MIYIITPEQKEMIEDALAVSTTPLNKDRQTVLKAFAIMKSLKVQELTIHLAMSHLFVSMMKVPYHFTL